MTREQAVTFLVKHPVKLMNMLGFTKMGELHNDWMRRMILGKDDETLQAHRNSYKTTCVSGVLSIIMVVYPNDRTLFQRKTDDDVKEIVDQVRGILVSPHMQYFVQCMYGCSLRLLKDNAVEMQTNLTTDLRGTSQLVAMGIGGSLTGKHFERIFTDDIVNLKDRLSKAERDRTKAVYYELHNVLNPGGRIFNTGTPWHKDDAFTLMPEPLRYDCYSTGIMTPEEIQEKREAMTAALFAANYELKHIASDDVIFVSPRVGGDPAMVEQGIVHIDAAYGGEDYTAATYCRKSNGTYFILGKLWHKAVDECEDEIIALRKKFLCGKVFCEDNADKGYLAKSLRKKGERVVTYHETENKYMKIVTNLKPEWKNVVFVDGTDPEYIDQICDYNEQADHDDAPDSLASVVRQLLKKKDSDLANEKYNSVFGGIYG